MNAAPGMSLEPGASSITGVRLGFRTAASRLTTRASILLIGLSLALVLSAGLIERRVTTWGSVDRSLISAFRLVIPLYCFAMTSMVCQGLGLREAAWSVARFGAARRDVALGVVLALVTSSMLGGFVLSVFAVLSAFGAASRPLANELFTSGWIGALVAGAYAAWFAFGSAFLNRGRGRWIPLICDLLFGAGTGALAAIFPRSHARGLLGEIGPTHFSQPQSCVALIVMVFVLVALSMARSRD
jgi:hypothetical protein